MPNELHELFQLAARFFYKAYKQGGGSQGKLAAQLGITNSYLSSVMGGARKASLELQIQIANRLYGPYDKFLIAGRKIKEGRDPLEKEKGKPLDPVEKLLAQLTHYVLDHQRIEQELQVSQEKYRDISLTSGDMIFEVDQDFNIIYVSGKVLETVGRNSADLLGRNIYDFLDERESLRLMDLIRVSIKKQNIIDTVLTITTDTEKKYRHLIAKPVFNSNGEFRGARGTYRDITKRKNLEKDLGQQNWLLQVALDSVDNCGIVISDAQNTVLKWNMEYKRLLNHSQEILKSRDALQYIAETKEKTANPEQFERHIKEAARSRSAITHTFELLDGRTIERKVIPLFKDDVLVGRIAHLKNIKKSR